MPLFIAPALAGSREASCLAEGTKVPFTALHSNPSANFARCHSRDANDFIPAGLAGRYGNGRTGNIQKICEEFDAGLVGSAFGRRRSERKLKRIAEFAGDGILFRARVNLDCEADTCRSVENRNHGFQFHHRVTDPRRTSAIRSPETYCSLLNVISCDSLCLCGALPARPFSKNCCSHSDTRRAFLDRNFEIV